MGGAQGLLNMLADAKDDRTRKEALKALAAISDSGSASITVEFLSSFLIVPYPSCEVR